MITDIITIILTLFVISSPLHILFILIYIDFPKMDVKINFSSFKEFYLVNPQKWAFNDNYAVYYPNVKDNSSSDYYRVGFDNLISVWKYKRFIRYVKKYKIEMKKQEQMADFLKLIQNDISQYQEKSLNEMKKYLCNGGMGN